MGNCRKDGGHDMRKHRLLLCICSGCICVHTWGLSSHILWYFSELICNERIGYIYHSIWKKTPHKEFPNTFDVSSRSIFVKLVAVNRKQQNSFACFPIKRMTRTHKKRFSGTVFMRASGPLNGLSAGLKGSKSILIHMNLYSIEIWSIVDHVSKF